MDAQWVERQVEVIKRKDDRLRLEQEVRLHDSKVIESQAPRFLTSLIASIDEYTQALSKEFPDQLERRLRLNRGQDGMFSVSTARVSLHCTLNLPGRCIFAHSSNGPVVIGNRIVENGALVKFRVESDGSLGVVSGFDLLGADELAKQIIGFLLERSSGAIG